MCAESSATANTASWLSNCEVLRLRIPLVLLAVSLSSSAAASPTPDEDAPGGDDEHAEPVETGNLDFLSAGGNTEPVETRDRTPGRIKDTLSRADAQRTRGDISSRDWFG